MEIQEDFITTNGRDAINKVIEDVVHRVPYSAVVDNTGIQSNDDIDMGGDKTHDYDICLIAQRYLEEIDNAILNYQQSGTQALPLMYHQKVQINEHLTNDFEIRVAWPPVWMNPAPSTHQVLLMRSDNADLSNPTQISSITATNNTHSVIFTGQRPAPDSKYYFGGITGTNTNGTSTYYTASADAYHNV